MFWGFGQPRKVLWHETKKNILFSGDFLNFYSFNLGHTLKEESISNGICFIAKMI